mmetsp:Transcript_21776/g.3607  ORF Transcript_21776/g.3607 Transcript_21776/m.3607 type:complete len:97 (-) Transcript_21776:164-454(-)
MQDPTDVIRNETKTGELDDPGNTTGWNKDNLNHSQGTAPNTGYGIATDEIPYIDFEQFCVYLSVFCPKIPIDRKIQFAFRLFDFDEDGVLKKSDIK